MVSFAQVLKLFRNSTSEEFSTDAATPFAQYSTSRTSDPFSHSLSLSSCLFPALSYPNVICQHLRKMSI